MTPNAITSMSREITIQEIDDNAPIVAELLDYIRWLADRDTGHRMTIGDVWTLYHDGIRVGRVWSEICADLGLPIRDVW